MGNATSKARTPPAPPEKSGCQSPEVTDPEAGTLLLARLEQATRAAIVSNARPRPRSFGETDEQTRARLDLPRPRPSFCVALFWVADHNASNDGARAALRVTSPTGAVYGDAHELSHAIVLSPVEVAAAREAASEAKKNGATPEQANAAYRAARANGPTATAAAAALAAARKDDHGEFFRAELPPHAHYSATLARELVLCGEGALGMFGRSPVVVMDVVHFTAPPDGVYKAEVVLLLPEGFEKTRRSLPSKLAFGAVCMHSNGEIACLTQCRRFRDASDPCGALPRGDTREEEPWPQQDAFVWSWGEGAAHEVTTCKDDDNPQPNRKEILGPDLYEEILGPDLWNYASKNFGGHDWQLIDIKHEDNPYWWQKESQRALYREGVREMMYQHTVPRRWKELPREVVEAAPCDRVAPWFSPKVMDYWVQYFKDKDKDELKRARAQVRFMRFRT